MSIEEAIAYAQRGRGKRKRPNSGWESLTPTETDVVRLVREGLANKDIAARLLISPPDRANPSHPRLHQTRAGLARTACAGGSSPRLTKISEHRRRCRVFSLTAAVRPTDGGPHRQRQSRWVPGAGIATTVETLKSARITKGWCVNRLLARSFYRRSALIPNVAQSLRPCSRHESRGSSLFVWTPVGHWSRCSFVVGRLGWVGGCIEHVQCGIQYRAGLVAACLACLTHRRGGDGEKFLEYVVR